MNQISNNLANVDTTGYKKENNTFWEILISKNGNPERVGKGVKVITNHQPGSAKATDSPLDLMINGDGYFKIQAPQGVRYTRAGNFSLNGQKQLVTSSGYLVLGEGGSIVLDGSKVAIGSDGTVNVDGRPVDRLAIVNFTDPESLTKEGQNFFRLKDAAIAEEVPEEFEVQQGFLETSNVNTISEMTAMMDLYRNYESQQRVISVIDSMNGDAVSRLGRLAS